MMPDKPGSFWSSHRWFNSLLALITRPNTYFTPSSFSYIFATASYPLVVAPISSCAIDYHYLHFAFLSIIPICRARTSLCFSRLYIPPPGQTTTIQFFDSVCSCIRGRRPTSWDKLSIQLWAWRAPFLSTHSYPLLSSSDPGQTSNLRSPNPNFNTTDHTHTSHTLHQQHSIMNPRSSYFCVLFLSLCAASLDTSFQSALAGESFLIHFLGCMLWDDEDGLYPQFPFCFFS